MVCRYSFHLYVASSNLLSPDTVGIKYQRFQLTGQHQIFCRSGIPRWIAILTVICNSTVHRCDREFGDLVRLMVVGLQCNLLRWATRRIRRVLAAACRTWYVWIVDACRLWAAPIRIVLRRRTATPICSTMGRDITVAVCAALWWATRALASVLGLTTIRLRR